MMIPVHCCASLYELLCDAVFSISDNEVMTLCVVNYRVLFICLDDFVCDEVK